MNGAAWSAAEINVLREHYPAGMTLEDLVARLRAVGPGRTAATVRTRALSLGLKRAVRAASSISWTGQEDAVIRDGYARGAAVTDIAVAVSAVGLARSAGAVIRRAAHLGLRWTGKRPVAGAWLAEHDDILRAGRERGESYEQIAEALCAAGRQGTTRNACIGRYARVATASQAPGAHRAAAPARKTESVRRAHVPKAPTASNAPAQIRAQVLQPAVPPAAPSGPSERKAPRPPLSPAPTGGVAFLVAGADACRWPLRGTGIDLVICGGGRGAGHSYCPAHMRMAYQRTDTRAVRPPASDMQRARPARAERETDLVDLLACGEAA